MRLGQEWVGCGACPSSPALSSELPAGLTTSESLSGSPKSDPRPAGLSPPVVGLQTGGTSGPACGSGSLAPRLLWESRGEAGQPGALSGSNDFSVCPQNKCATDKTVWSGAEELL